MAFDLGDYKDVPTRIGEFRDKHPEGSLRPLNPEKPFELVTIGERTFIVVVAAAFRTPDDAAPGVGMAWEQFPGTTNYTRNSELQNAETSAWGRAIVAALASESKAVASQEDVRNRQAEHEPMADAGTHEAIRNIVANLDEQDRDDFAQWWKSASLPSLKGADRLTESQARLAFDYLDAAATVPV